MSGKPNMSPSELHNLYNSNIKSIQRVDRPMTSSDNSKNVPFVHHQGNLVEMKDGNKFLIQHGPNYGKSQDCVITPASNMSNNWNPVGAKIPSSAKVGDLMKEGGAEKTYGLLGNNCITSANRVIN